MRQPPVLRRHETIHSGIARFPSATDRSPLFPHSVPSRCVRAASAEPDDKVPKPCWEAAAAACPEDRIYARFPTPHDRRAASPNAALTLTRDSGLRNRNCPVTQTFMVIISFKWRRHDYYIS